MAVKQFEVKIINEPMLSIWYSYFDPVSFRLAEFETRIPLAGLRLTEPERGRQGGFRTAKLLGSDGTVQLEFGKSEQAFYDAVKSALEKKP
jgi:hypothetical protein